MIPRRIRVAALWVAAALAFLTFLCDCFVTVFAAQQAQPAQVILANAAMAAIFGALVPWIIQEIQQI